MKNGANGVGGVVDKVGNRYKIYNLSRLTKPILIVVKGEAFQENGRTDARINIDKQNSFA